MVRLAGGVRPGEVALDLGCGDGAVLLEVSGLTAPSPPARARLCVHVCMRKTHWKGWGLVEGPKKTSVLM